MCLLLPRNSNQQSHAGDSVDTTPSIRVSTYSGSKLGRVILLEWVDLMLLYSKDYLPSFHRR